MQNFNGMNDFVAMMQQFGMNGGNMQKYVQAYQQMQSQGMPQNMFQAYQQFRKNLGMQGDISQEQFQTMQSQMQNIPPEQLNQVKTVLSQNGFSTAPNPNNQTEFSGGF